MKASKSLDGKRSTTVLPLDVIRACSSKVGSSSMRFDLVIRDTGEKHSVSHACGSTRIQLWVFNQACKAMAADFSTSSEPMKRSISFADSEPCVPRRVLAALLSISGA